MKTVESLQKEIGLLEKKSRSTSAKKAVRNRAKKRMAFIQDCILLINSGLTHDAAVKQAKELRDRYGRAKKTFYEAHTTEDADGKPVKVKNILSRFHNTGARQMWRQIQTFKFLLSA